MEFLSCFQICCVCRESPLLPSLVCRNYSVKCIPMILLLQIRLMEENLRDHQRAQDEAITKTQLLEQTVKSLEYELEAKNHLKDDRARQIKLMEVRDILKVCFFFEDMRIILVFHVDSAWKELK